MNAQRPALLILLVAFGASYWAMDGADAARGSVDAGPTPVTSRQAAPAPSLTSVSAGGPTVEDTRADGARSTTTPTDGHRETATTRGRASLSEFTDASPRWPRVAAATGVVPTTVDAPTQPVPSRLAFKALWYLGVDPTAERTWARAINDLRHPPGLRSDLIADMVDEGYSDNSHPGPEDLATIEARLAILERHAPHAVDEVNARAFEATYRALLEMYIRLGGDPSSRLR